MAVFLKSATLAFLCPFFFPQKFSASPGFSILGLPIPLL